MLELDELWSFLQSKANTLWLWVALCRRTRQIVAYTLGDRSQQSAGVPRRWISSVNSTHESKSVQTLLELVGRGKGVALVPSWAKTLPNERVVFHPLSKSISVEMGVAVSRQGRDQRLLEALA